MDLSTRMKMQEWSQDYADWKSSGLTQKKGCQEQGIALSTFGYHGRRIKEEASKIMKNDKNLN